MIHRGFCHKRQPPSFGPGATTQEDQRANAPNEPSGCLEKVDPTDWCYFEVLLVLSLLFLVLLISFIPPCSLHSCAKLEEYGKPNWKLRCLVSQEPNKNLTNLNNC